MKNLKRFWVRFDMFDHPTPLNLGCGITAYDIEDVYRILGNKVFYGSEIPNVKEIIEDVDISNMDQGHVSSNMGNHFIRGVWFPLGH